MSDNKQKEQAHEYGRDQVVQIINSVIQKVEHNENFSRLTVFEELKDLQAIIEEARSDIGMARPGDINEKHIPTATDELDAVVAATAEATGTIMDACEAIQDAASGLQGEYTSVIDEQVIKIYEACSFQDITGQRISKVVSTLGKIEEKVAQLVSVLQERLPVNQDEQTDRSDEGEGDGLLNGPQMPDKAINQDDIDKLLAEFG